MKVPTDLKILNAIYDEYYEVFANFSLEADIDNGRAGKTHIPIDCKHIAEKLKVDSDIVFGRLYYHLEPKYGFKKDGGSRVAFFTLMLGSERHCVNFPLLASVLAGLQEENDKVQTATWLSRLAIIISLAVPFVDWLNK